MGTQYTVSDPYAFFSMIWARALQAADAGAFRLHCIQ
jgi:hypothetical protein